MTQENVQRKSQAKEEADAPINDEEETALGGMFYCGQCGKTRHSKDGYNAAKLEDGKEFEFCERCYVAVAAAHLSGDRRLSELDGKSLLTHLVRPEHIDVRPVTPEEVYRQYLANCRANNFPATVPDRCIHCGFAIVMAEAEAIMSGGGWGMSGCRGCGRSYCD